MILCLLCFFDSVSHYVGHYDTSISLLDAPDTVFATKRSRLPKTSVTGDRTDYSEQQTSNTWRKPSRLELHTGSDVTDVPHAQPVPLSSKRVDEGKIRTAGAAEDHTLRETDSPALKPDFTQSCCSDVVRRRYATIFMSLEWIRLGLFPRMSQIFTCLSAEDVTRQPRIWLLKSIPTAEVTQGSHCDTIRVFVNILNQFLFFFIYFLFAFKF